jgi:hypothetical protein
MKDIIDDYGDDVGVKELLEEIITNKQRHLERLNRLLAA